MEEFGGDLKQLLGWAGMIGRWKVGNGGMIGSFVSAGMGHNVWCRFAVISASNNLVPLPFPCMRPGQESR